jgi:predicted enzyme related to lactoylglutathione lyase
MPEKNGFDPGHFCWIELGTTDAKGAQDFYSALFGWSVETGDAGEAGPYHMFRLDGRDAGGMYTLMKEQVEQGVPPHWMSYLSVASADETAKRAGELGGHVVMGPMDVMDVGRMAVVADPTGAMFALWQAKSHQGLGRVDDVSTPCWFELATKDAKQSGPFFCGLFGWEAVETPMGEMTYTMFKHGEGHVGGMMQMTAEWGDTPSHWMIYFTVAECEAACARVEELGGKVCVPPTDVPGVGRFAVVNDPQGAYFSVIKLSAPEGA